jgi:hypothetical protein
LQSVDFHGSLLLTFHRTLPGGFMGILDLPKKWRERAHGDATLLACADELEAHLKDASLCRVSAGTEIHFELIVSDSVFKATNNKTTSCTLSMKSGDMRRATLVFA